MKRKREEVDLDNECLICISEMNNKNKVVLECCHIYHSECVINLIKKRTRKCPLCRTKIKWNTKQLKRHIELSN